MTLRDRARRLRREYVANPTRAALRAYLIVQARRGIYDERMFRYYDVSPFVNAACRRAVVRAYADGLVPTSTRRLPVSRTASFHQRRNSRGEGMAVDFGLIERHIGTRYGRDKMVAFQRAELRRDRSRAILGLTELIGPDNEAIILRGRETDLVEGTALEQQHDTHVHEAYAG